MVFESVYTGCYPVLVKYYPFGVSSEDRIDMEWLADILQYLKDHPEVTWSGAGISGLGVLYVLITKLFAPLFRRGRDAGVEVKQTVKGDNNIVAGTGDVKVERR